MTEDSPIVVRARDFTRVFRDFWGRPKVTAVDHISFEVKRGTIFGLLGPNGSGKSTTIKAMLGLLKPTAGELTILGQPPSDVITKSRIGYLPEASYLYPHLTARETLNFYARLFNIPPEVRKERIDQLLHMVGLAHRTGQTVGEYSKGMARRLGIAQCLINDPELIILDEPTSGLDPIGTSQVKELIQLLKKRGKTIVLCSHLMADVEDVCDELVILFGGSICAAGDIEALLTDRDRLRITLPDTGSETTTQILDFIEKAAGSRPSLERPRDDLEHYFVEVVRAAQKDESQSSHLSGASQFNQLAPFLSNPEQNEG